MAQAWLQNGGRSGGAASYTSARANRRTSGRCSKAAAATPPLERVGRPHPFEPLRQTRYEVEDVAGQFEEALVGDALLFLGDEATKASLVVSAPKARFLHVATHGWFAGEAFKSLLDDPPSRGGDPP